MWTWEVKCESLIQESWRHHSTLSDRLRESRRRLAQWDKNEFRSLHHCIKVLESELEHVLSSLASMESLKHRDELSKELHRLLCKEEQY